MAQKTETETRTGTARQQEPRNLERTFERNRGLSRREPFESFAPGPFGMIRRMQEDMDRIFSNFGLGRSSLFAPSQAAEWSPAVDVFQRGNEFVVRADVPGLNREDLTVEIGDDELTICGERKYDREEEDEGVYRSERQYGSFCRIVALPEGVVADSAKANFKNGVLEVVMQAPPNEVRRGRQVQITEGDKRSGGNPERK